MNTVDYNERLLKEAENEIQWLRELMKKAVDSFPDRPWSSVKNLFELQRVLYRSEPCDMIGDSS